MTSSSPAPTTDLVASISASNASSPTTESTTSSSPAPLDAIAFITRAFCLVDTGDVTRTLAIPAFNITAASLTLAVHIPPHRQPFVPGQSRTLYVLRGLKPLPWEPKCSAMAFMLISMVGRSSTKAGVGNSATSSGRASVTGSQGRPVTAFSAKSIAVVKPPPTVLLPRVQPRVQVFKAHRRAVKSHHNEVIEQ